MGEFSIDEVSGEVKGDPTLEGEVFESLRVLWLSELVLEVVEADRLLGKISGALYESMFVVEISSIGAEIFCCRMVPEKLCFVVKLRWGMAAKTSTSEVFRLRFVVKARDSEDEAIFADFAEFPGEEIAFCRR